MNRKDKRSMCLMLLLGDGNLHNWTDKKGKSYCRLTIDHGISQSDYQIWKANLLSFIFGKKVVTRSGHKGKSIQVSTTVRRLKAWKKFTYPNNKKDLARILPFITNPEMAMAVWLMDDGYVESSISKNARGEKVNYGARFRLFTCDQTMETQEYIVSWLNQHFDINVKITSCFSKKQNKSYPFIKFNGQDSLIIWEKIRSFVLQFDSMKYKFRYIEQIFQKRLSQRTPSPVEDDIVGTTMIK